MPWVIKGVVVKRVVMKPVVVKLLEEPSPDPFFPWSSFFSSLSPTFSDPRTKPQLHARVTGITEPTPSKSSVLRVDILVLRYSTIKLKWSVKNEANGPFCL
jgi:hypothetical protein